MDILCTAICKIIPRSDRTTLFVFFFGKIESVNLFVEMDENDLQRQAYQTLLT